MTLDYPNLRELARKDPELFLQTHQPPLIIDEIQYAPELLPYIKIRIDCAKSNGLYFLTGSQLFHMMKNVSESFEKIYRGSMPRLVIDAALNLSF